MVVAVVRGLECGPHLKLPPIPTTTFHMSELDFEKSKGDEVIAEVLRRWPRATVLNDRNWDESNDTWDEQMNTYDHYYTRIRVHLDDDPEERKRVCREIIDYVEQQRDSLCPSFLEAPENAPFFGDIVLSITIATGVLSD